MRVKVTEKHHKYVQMQRQILGVLNKKPSFCAKTIKVNFILNYNSEIQLWSFETTKTNKLPFNKRSFVLLLSLFRFLLTLNEQQTHQSPFHSIFLYLIQTHTQTHTRSLKHIDRHTHSHTHAQFLSLTCMLTCTSTHTH